MIDVRVTARGLQGYSVHSVKLLMTFDYQLNVRNKPQLVAALRSPLPRRMRSPLAKTVLLRQCADIESRRACPTPRRGG